MGLLTFEVSDHLFFTGVTGLFTVWYYVAIVYFGVTHPSTDGIDNSYCISYTMTNTLSKTI